jgi:hypothetical protein
MEEEEEGRRRRRRRKKRRISAPSTSGVCAQSSHVPTRARASLSSRLRRRGCLFLQGEGGVLLSQRKIAEM